MSLTVELCLLRLSKMVFLSGEFLMRSEATRKPSSHHSAILHYISPPTPLTIYLKFVIAQLAQTRLLLKVWFFPVGETICKMLKKVMHLFNSIIFFSSQQDAKFCPRERFILPSNFYMMMKNGGKSQGFLKLTHVLIFTSSSRAHHV